MPEWILNLWLKAYDSDVVEQMLQAFQRETCEREIKNAEGAVSGGFVMPYPPGVPLLVPGERINRKVLDRLMVYLEEGLTVYGVHKGKIELLKE